MLHTDQNLMEAASPEQSGSSGRQQIEKHPRWEQIARLPALLVARIPLRRFTVRALLALEPGTLLTSAWLATDDVPLKMGAVQLAWCEFEVVDKSMAVRVTRLA